MSNLRRVKALNISGLQKAEIKYKPDLMWVKLYQLRINDEYQRKIGEKSITLIRKIIKDFDWAKFHPPIITMVGEEDGSPIYEVLDGQHTAIAMVSHGQFREIPCLVVVTDDVTTRADAFVGLNSNKVNITPIQVFWAKVTAKNELALDVIEGAKEAGATILRGPPAYGIYAKGSTLAVGSLINLAQEGGSYFVRRVLECGVAAELAPISRDFISAFKILLLGKSDLKIRHPEASKLVSLIIRRVGQDKLIADATHMHKGSGSTLGYCLAVQISRYVNEVST